MSTNFDRYTGPIINLRKTDSATGAPAVDIISLETLKQIHEADGHGPDRAGSLACTHGLAYEYENWVYGPMTRLEWAECAVQNLFPTSRVEAVVEYDHGDERDQFGIVVYPSGDGNGFALHFHVCLQYRVNPRLMPVRCIEDLMSRFPSV